MSPLITLLPHQQGLSFDEDAHRYQLWVPRLGQWVRVMSTSQVLTESGAKGFDSFYWRRSLIEKHGMRGHEADAYMELHRNGRADIGTELHGLIRAELLGGSFHPRHAESLMLLATWRREFLPEIEQVLLCEAALCSRWGLFSGTPDLVARVGGRWLVLDWKSKVSEEKAKPEPAWPLQLAGYDLLVTETHGLRLDGAMNLMIWPGECREVFYNRADVDQQIAKFIGFLAWSHRIQASDGSLIHSQALDHLLKLFPGALDRVPMPKGFTLPPF